MVGEYDMSVDVGVYIQVNVGVQSIMYVGECWSELDWVWYYNLLSV